MINQTMDAPSKEQLLKIVNTERRADRQTLIQTLRAEGEEMTEIETIAISVLLRESQMIDSEIESLQAKKCEVSENIITHDDRRKGMLSEEKLVNFDPLGMSGCERVHPLHFKLVEFDVETNNMLRDVCHL